MMTKNKTLLGVAAAGVAVVGSVITSALMTATIVANAKNKEAIEKMDNEMREKNKRFKDIEEFRKQELEELKKKKEDIIEEIETLEALKRKKQTDLKMVCTSIKSDDNTKAVLTVVSSIQDSLISMALTTADMKKEIADLKGQSGR